LRFKRKSKYKAIKVEYDGIVFDSKLEGTQVFKLKKKLVEALYPGTVIVIVKDPRAAVVQEKTA
jgi:trehalose-6-phosphatase